MLSTRAKTSHIFPHLQSGALISIGKICDDGCTATFTATHLIVEKKGYVVLERTCKGVAGMWYVHLATTPQPSPTPTRQSGNNMIADRTKPDLTQWYHTILFSPVNHNLIQSTKKGYFATWPILTIDLINKPLPPSMATAKGHMHQTRKNIKSTKQQEPVRQEDPSIKPLAQRTNTVFTKIIDHKRKIATYLIGKFPVTSNRGNKYIFVLYEYNINIILIRPMKVRSDR